MSPYWKSKKIYNLGLKKQLNNVVDKRIALFLAWLLVLSELYCFVILWFLNRADGLLLPSSFSVDNSQLVVWPHPFHLGVGGHLVSVVELSMMISFRGCSIGFSVGIQRYWKAMLSLLYSKNTCSLIAFWSSRYPFRELFLRSSNFSFYFYDEIIIEAANKCIWRSHVPFTPTVPNIDNFHNYRAISKSGNWHRYNLENLFRFHQQYTHRTWWNFNTWIALCDYHCFL